ncbi:MAG: imidazole glycerol phosphate synthase subunit HisH [Collinsella sp.]
MGEPKIVVVDYHKGNLSSVVRGLARAGAAACTSDDPEQIRRADGLVIPGVGAFYDAIAFVRQSGEEAAVLDAVAAGTPLLGICLGLQLFFERGNEGVPADESVAATAAPLSRPAVPGSMAWASCAVRARAWNRAA